MSDSHAGTAEIDRHRNLWGKSLIVIELTIS